MELRFGLKRMVIFFVVFLCVAFATTVNSRADSTSYAKARYVSFDIRSVAINVCGC